MHPIGEVHFPNFVFDSEFGIAGGHGHRGPGQNGNQVHGGFSGCIGAVEGNRLVVASQGE